MFICIQSVPQLLGELQASPAIPVHLSSKIRTQLSRTAWFEISAQSVSLKTVVSRGITIHYVHHFTSKVYKKKIQRQTWHCARHFQSCVHNLWIRSIIHHWIWKKYSCAKSNQFYCHITTAHVPWWVKFLRACYILTDFYRWQCAEYTYKYSVHTVYY